MKKDCLLLVHMLWLLRLSVRGKGFVLLQLLDVLLNLNFIYLFYFIVLSIESSHRTIIKIFFTYEKKHFSSVEFKIIEFKCAKFIERLV